MSTMMAASLAIVVGYLIGSIPLAMLIAARHRVDLRASGDRNPGYWNARSLLDRRSSIAVFVGDLSKGLAACLVARALGGPWWVGYLGAAAVMLGHAFPVFAGFRGGRSILCFAGSVIVLAPFAAALGVGACLIVTAVSRRFSYGARVAVFGFPVIQAFLEARAHVAATGGLMTIIGVRFVMAAVADRRTAQLPNHDG
jgi:acyl phosphate:glycerol-3-phosphate acyltransferase